MAKATFHRRYFPGFDADRHRRASIPVPAELALAVILHMERSNEGYDKKILGSRDFRGIIPLRPACRA